MHGMRSRIARNQIVAVAVSPVRVKEDQGTRGLLHIAVNIAKSDQRANFRRQPAAPSVKGENRSLSEVQAC